MSESASTIVAGVDAATGFVTPDAKIVCAIGPTDLACGVPDGGWVGAPRVLDVAGASEKPADAVAMDGAGKLTYTAGTVGTLVDHARPSEATWWGEPMGARTVSGRRVAVLPRGVPLGNGRFTCTVGVEVVCTVVASGQSIRVGASGVHAGRAG